MSDIRFNQWLHQSGTGGVSQDHIGNIGIGTTNPSIVVSAANTAVLNVGVITANNLFVNNAFNGDITGNVTGNISGATGTFSGNVDIADKIIHTGDTDTAMRFPADNTFAVDTAGSERLRVTDVGRLLINTTTVLESSNAAKLHIAHTSGALLALGRDDSAVSDGNDLGKIAFYGNDGGAYEKVAQILCEADGSHASGDKPGRIMFQTTADGASSPTERLRITSDGDVKIKSFGNASNASADALQIGKTDNNYGITILSATNAQGRIDFTDTEDTNDPQGKIAYYHDTNSLQFFTNGGAASNERLRITSDGRVLINATNNPTIGGQTPNLYVSSYTNLDGLRIRGLDTGNTIWKTGGDMSLTVDSAHSIYFKTNGSTGLQVTSGGQVATPLQPRFFARRSATYTGYDGRNVGSTWITFDVEDYDVGGNFATSGSDQGLFVAPVSGLYLFHAAAYKNTGTADWSQSWFNINGSRANGTDFVHSSATRFAQNAIQVYMTAGQKIGFHPYNNATGNEIMATGTHTWFKGCLLG